MNIDKNNRNQGKNVEKMLLKQMLVDKQLLHRFDTLQKNVKNLQYSKYTITKTNK